MPFNDLILNNKVLTNIVIGARYHAGIADKVCPSVPVTTATGEYIKNSLVGLELIDSERALRAEPGKVDVNYLTKGTYVCKEHALSTALDYKEIEAAEQNGGAKAVMSLKKRAALKVINLLNTGNEKRAADLIFNADSYATGNKVNLAGSEFDASSNPTNPFDAFNSGKDVLRSKSGVKPNTLILGYVGLQSLLKNPLILAKLSANERNMLGIDTLKTLLGFENIIVGESIYKDSAGTAVDMWGKHASLCYLPKKGLAADIQPVHAINFAQQNSIKSFEVKKPYLLEIHVNRMSQINIVANEFAYFLQNIVA